MADMTDLEDVLGRRDIVLNLYQIVLGRKPDPGGLAHYTSRPPDDLWQRTVALNLLESDEFKEATRSEAPSVRLCRNAEANPVDQPDDTPSLVDLVCDLVGRRDVLERLAAARARRAYGVAIDDPINYPLWLAERRARRLGAIRSVTSTGAPLLSVIIHGPVDIGALDASLDSLAPHRAPGVDVVVALDRPPDARLQALLERHAALRVRFGRRRFRHASVAALNKAARAAQGTFVCLLQAGDGIDEAAVPELAQAADTADVLLSDADRLDTGTGFQPALTGGWDAEAALARPPDGLVIIRTALLHAIGSFRAAAEGEQAWDVLLRASNAVDATRIRHVPAVLLHRASRAHVMGHGVGRDIVRRHLDRTHRGACRIDGDGFCEPIRVVYPLPASPPLASVIVATRDRATLLRPCLEGLLRRTAYPALEVIVLDNDSREPETAELLGEAARDPRVSVVPHAGPFNWSALNNRAVQLMRGEVAVFLNNDTDVIEPNWLREMVAQAMRPSIGIVGAKLLYPDRTIQHAGVGMDPHCQSLHVWRHADGIAPGYLDQLRIVRTVAAVTGACLAIRRTVFLEVGGLDEEHLRVTWNDTDLCMRVRAAGYAVVWTPHALLYHVELGTRGSDDTPEARPRFRQESAHFRARWRGFADTDPYHSPSLIKGCATPRLKPVDEIGETPS